MPNLLSPSGNSRGREGMLEGIMKGRQILSSRSYIIRNAVAAGDRVAMEIEWTGTLAADFGSVESGAQLKAFLGIFMRFEDGKVIEQRNYDSYDPATLK